MTRINEVINIDRKDLSGTIGGWIIGEPKKTLEEIIQQVKIDMYKDRYKTYDSPHTSCFYT